MSKVARVTSGKRHRRGLEKIVSAFREKSGLSLQVAATQANVSIPRWRDAESFGLATDETLLQLAKVGVDVSALLKAG